MQWRNPREKQLGVELGFIVSSVGTTCRYAGVPALFMAGSSTAKPFIALACRGPIA